MAGEATQAEINAAQDISMEGTGDSVIGDVNGAESIFGERMPTEDELKAFDSSNVDDPASLLSLEERAKKESEKTALTGDDPAKKKESEANEDDPAKKIEPDDLAKVTEHRNNLEKALSEQRAKNKSLQFMLDQRKFDPPKIAPKEIPKNFDPDFKILSKEEFSELKEKDAVVALQYFRDESDYKEGKMAYDRAVLEAQDTQNRINLSISDSLEQIALAVPGVYDNEEIGQKLTAFAVEKGFTGQELTVLSNPATMYLPEGSTTPIPLGSAAVAFVKFCNNQMSGTDITAIEKTITERVTKELLQKFKTDPGSLNASLGDIPSSGLETAGQWAPKTEEELSRMSERDRDAYFAGAVA